MHLPGVIAQFFSPAMSGICSQTENTKPSLARVEIGKKTKNKQKNRARCVGAL
jgi:hypothetical protein